MAAAPAEPSVPQVPLWHGFIGRMCLFKRTLVCPGELLQAESTIYSLPRRQGRIFVAGAVYEMACGHCRRPRKEILALNFDQLCWIRGLSSSPKSQGWSKVVLRGSKMDLEIAFWHPENSPSRPEAHPGRALALPAPRKAPGNVRAAADCTSPGGRPGGATATSARQPSPPQTSFSYLVNYYL